MTARMTCRDVIEFLADYLDGELAQDVRDLFDQHLATCRGCLVYLQTYSETIRMARASGAGSSVELSEFPEDLVAAILSARKV